jgi:glycosyltransferase involved in cell wall biosynthesis
MKKIVFIAAAPMSLKAFMRNHMLELSKEYRVYAIADFTPEEESEMLALGLHPITISIPREISPWADFSALISLYKLFSKERFDMIQSITPKAGLLAMMAGRIANIKQRIHWFTGQVWVTRQGLMRSLLRAADRLIAVNATYLLVDSPSQKLFLETERVLVPGQSTVLGIGSISGVDLNRFKPNSIVRNHIRSQLNIPTNELVFVFLGRLNRDKGILDLALAFSRLAEEFSNVTLLIVGPDEGHLSGVIDEICFRIITKVKKVSFTNSPENYLTCSDILVLPSYREGFGNTVIEAAACGLPSIASRIYGLTDAVQENVTGLMSSAGDTYELHANMKALVMNSDLRSKMADAALKRAHSKFSMEAITRHYLGFIENNVLHASISELSKK